MREGTRAGIDGHPEPGFAARMGAKVHSLKDQLNAVAVERDMLRTQLEALRTEADSLRQRADSSAAAKEADLLRQQLRGLKHRQKFDEIAFVVIARITEHRIIDRSASVDADQPPAVQMCHEVYGGGSSIRRPEVRELPKRQILQQPVKI